MVRTRGSHSWTLVIAAATAMLGCSTEAKPPAPALPTELPVGALDELPTDEEGRPVVAEGRVGGPDSLQVVYDDTRIDPLRLWGECLGRVAGCYATNNGRLRGCVDYIEICEAPEGGMGCCPSTCLDAYHSARASGMGEDEAVDTTFRTGECIPGFRDQIARLETTVEP